MQRYFAREKIDNKFILNNDDLYHIRTVMRMNESDKIEVVYNHQVYICSLHNVNNDIIIEIFEMQPDILKNEVEIVLAIPILKEQKMDYILQKSTELGVSKIIPFIASRSVVKLNSDKEEGRILRWQKICKEASEQSKRVDIPIVTRVKTIKDLKNFEGRKFVCSTKKDVNNIKMFLQKHTSCDKLLLVIGPEGGLANNEEDYLVSVGFIPVSLGNRIMRVETAPLFILSVINYEMME